MFKNETNLTIVDQLNIYNGSKIISNRQGIGSLVAYRFEKNAEALQKNIEDFEKQRMIIITELAVLDENGKPLIENGAFKFKTAELKAEADKKVSEMIGELGEDKFTLWHFEAHEVDKDDKASITGEIWKLIDKIVVDNNPT